MMTSVSVEDVERGGKMKLFEWTKEKPDFRCLFISRSKRRLQYEYNIWEITYNKEDGYKLLDSKGCEWGALEDLNEQEYMVIEDRREGANKMNEMIFKLKKDGSVGVYEEGNLLSIDIWDDAGGIGVIRIYKDGCIELESYVHGSKGHMHFSHVYDFFGSIVKWYNTLSKYNGKGRHIIAQNNDLGEGVEVKMKRKNSTTRTMLIHRTKK